MENNFTNVLVIGRGRSASSVSICLAASGSKVTLCSDDIAEARGKITTHLEDVSRYMSIDALGQIEVIKGKNWSSSHSLAIIAGYSDLSQINEITNNLESTGSSELVIAISTDHIELKKLQEGHNRPENIVVVNWAEPAHTTFFLEIVHNDTTDPQIVSQLENTARQSWRKDPYTVNSNLGVRGRMQTAMLREALYLIEEGYANVEDIDRACRNDAGTYLPFVGNFQYMDLMGTFAYGVVMEKLNKELSNSTNPPAFFQQLNEARLNGSSPNPEFYDYSTEDLEEWESRMRSFSFEIRELIDKYSALYQGDETSVDAKILTLNAKS